MSRYGGVVPLGLGIALLGCAMGGAGGSADHVPPGWRAAPATDEAGLWLPRTGTW
jgi:hypothetical protein